MRLFIPLLPFLFVAISGCEFRYSQEKTESNNFSGNRVKIKGKRARATPNKQKTVVKATTSPEQSADPQTASPQDNSEPQVESLIFPFTLTSNHNSLLVKSSDNKKISFHAKPETEPISLIAGLSGTISLNTENGVHYLDLIPDKGDQTLHFELSEEGTTVEIQNQAQVSQSQILMKSNKPIVFYVKTNSEIDLLCMNTADLEERLTVVKELPDANECL